MAQVAGATHRRNRYNGKCLHCRKEVLENAGITVHDGTKWRVYCNEECYNKKLAAVLHPTPATPTPTSTNGGVIHPTPATPTPTRYMLPNDAWMTRVNNGTDVPLQDEILVPIYPKGYEFWIQVVVEPPDQAGDSRVRVHSRYTLGYVGPTEGRKVIRGMLIEWLAGLTITDACTSSYHDDSRPLTPTELAHKQDSYHPSTLRDKWSLWRYDECWECQQTDSPLGEMATADVHATTPATLQPGSKVTFPTLIAPPITGISHLSGPNPPWSLTQPTYTPEPEPQTNLLPAWEEA